MYRIPPPPPTDDPDLIRVYLVGILLGAIVLILLTVIGAPLLDGGAH